MSADRAAITGLGLISALGVGAAATWRALREGRSGIAPIRRFSTDGLATHVGAMVDDAAWASAARADRAERFAVVAAEEALAEARRGAAVLARPGRLALVLGTSLGDGGRDLDDLASTLAARLGLDGPCVVVSTACSSSTHVVGLARDLLDDDRCDAALAGGTDELTDRLLAGFSALGVLSREACTPFGQVVGTSLGEGAGFVVVERERAAVARGARVRAFVLGHGLSADAHHPTSPDPAGRGVARAMSAALADAGLAPGDVAYVNAHGTGTAANDPAEWRAIEAVFGPGATPLVSSTKGHLGHAQGAAGILEIGAALLAVEQGLVPPTLGVVAPRPRGPVDPVPGPSPRALAVRSFLANGSAFGGANASVAIAPAPTALVPRPRPRREVHVVGAAQVGPADDLARELRGMDPREIDRTTAWLLVAVRRALDEAAVAGDPGVRARIGLFVAQTRPSPAAAHGLEASIATRGLARLHAPSFARVVLNAAAGAVTRALALRGPVTVVATGPSSGLVAAVLAADHLARRPDLAAMIVAGVHELDDGERGFEGAAALALVPGGGGAGLALRPVGLDAGGTRREPPPRERSIDPAVIVDGGGGAAGVVACARATALVRARESRAIVVHDARGCAAAAVALSQEEEER